VNESPFPVVDGSPIGDDTLNAAEHQAKAVHRWAILYWTIHNWFAVVSWAVSIAIPTLAAIMLYIPSEDARWWNICLLLSSCVGLILQVLSYTLRLRDRADHGRDNAARLEVALLRYRERRIDSATFVDEYARFLRRDVREPGP